MATKKQDTKKSRREFVKKAAYIAPAIATLKAAPSFAKVGSDKAPEQPNPYARQKQPNKP